MPRIVFVAHCIAGEVEKNMADLIRIIRRINLEHDDIVPFCPFYSDLVALDDGVPSEREIGLLNIQCIMRRTMIDELWLTGNRISAGMEAEIKLAEELGITVVMINKI